MFCILKTIHGTRSWLRKHSQPGAFPAGLTRVQTETDFVASLEKSGFHLILADYTLPSFDGLSTLQIARRNWPRVPFIFVSGRRAPDRWPSSVFLWREMTGYEVANLEEALAKARAAGVAILVARTQPIGGTRLRCNFPAAILRSIRSCGSFVRSVCRTPSVPAKRPHHPAADARG
jgi:CheY-like chemotaxis protein